MRHLLALICVLVLGGPGAVADKPVSPADGNADFAYSLYRRIAAQRGNQFLSPHSISTALAMTYAGARGETASQMAQALHLSTNQTHAGFGGLQAQLATRSQNKSIQLRVVNRLWAQADYAIGEPFSQVCKAHYGAEVGRVDFKAATEAARGTINDWVAARTEDKIKDLFPSGVLTPLTRLVLTNAIYFKGTWARPFDPKATRTGAFHVTPTTPVQVPLMSQTGPFRYGRNDDGVELLELPYKGGQLSMVILLPPAGGLGRLEQSLTTRAVRGWMAMAGQTKVRVTLPRFKVTRALRLDAQLKALGMTRAFQRGVADFSGIASTPGDLYVTAVVHKAFVDVNELGTEAAAATGVAIGTKSMPQTFRADRPFLFLIVDRPTGALLFMGRLADPTPAR